MFQTRREQAAWNQDLVLLHPSRSLVWSQINLQNDQESKISDPMMKEILNFVSEPSGSKELSGDLGNSKPRVGMRSRTEK